MIRLIIQPGAGADIDDAAEWYEGQASGLAVRSLDELDTCFARISANPAQYPFIAEPVRRALLRRFPYSVYFVVAGDAARVLAVAHQKRRPKSWKSR